MTIYYQAKYLIDYDICRVLHGFPRRDISACIDYSKIILSKGDIFVGDIRQTETVLHNSGLKWNHIPDFPDEIGSHFGRNIEKTTLENVINTLSSIKKPKFIKPVYKGLFPSFIYHSYINFMALLHVEETSDVWVQDFVDIDAEYRVFVCNKQILDVRCYKNWESKRPHRFWIESIIDQLPYETYILDAGSSRDGYLVIELNDGIAFGSYGLHPEHCAMMYKSRFEQIWKDNN